MKVESFKRILMNYYQYKESSKRLQEEIDLIVYRESNVKGIDYTKIHGTANESAISERRLSSIDMKEELEMELDYTKKAIQYIESVLNRIDPDAKEYILRILCGHETNESVGSEMGYSHSGMWKKVRSEIEKALKVDASTEHKG